MQVSIREAREQLSRLLKAVEQGDQVEITRRGRVVARLAPPVDKTEANTLARAAARAKLRASLPPSAVTAAELIRDLRDERG